MGSRCRRIDPVALEYGVRSSAAAPITVQGRLWGYIAVTSGRAEPPPGTEARLAAFTEIAATAIANSQAREELRAIADEQAALRRVAMLVAEAAAPGEVFATVVVTAPATTQPASQRVGWRVGSDAG